MSDQEDEESVGLSFYAEHNYTTSFLHLIMCGSAGYGLKKTNFSDRCSFTAMSILLGHSVLGVFRFGHPQHASKLRYFSRFNFLNPCYIFSMVILDGISTSL